MITCFLSFTAPRIGTVTCTSNNYTSIRLAITLLYTGGSPVTEFRIRYRIASTTSWESISVNSDHNSATTPWIYDLTNLQYDHHGYEVEITATNFIGPSDSAVTKPTKLFTGRQYVYSMLDQAFSTRILNHL